MTNDQVKAIELLWYLISTLEPKLHPLKSWYFDTLVKAIVKWQRSEGDQGIKRAKDALNRGWLAILGETSTVRNDPLPFVKAKDGIPELVRPLVDRVGVLRKDERLLSAVLTIVRITDLWQASGSLAAINKQLKVINDSKIPERGKDTVKEFTDFVAKFIASNPDLPVVKALSQPIRIGSSKTMRNPNKVGDFYSEKKGPNGPLTESAELDMCTLRSVTCSDNRTTLADAIVTLQNEIVKTQRFSLRGRPLWESLSIQDLSSGREYSPTPGKISKINEKSGKVRLVASPDYFSQMAMKPIHNWLMSALRALEPMDCTFNQRSSINRVSEWQSLGRTVYSYDQSSCTDLFPVVCQLAVLSSKSETLAEAAHTVMCDRDWEVKLPNGQTKTVRWGVGQPMGLYGSWPLMAITHHLLVQYAAWRSSGRKSYKIFKDYCICGDDIVLASKSVAESYLKVIKTLGMKVNLTKSHISGGKTGITPVSEFAKITIWNGKPLFPIRPNMVLRSLKDWRIAVPLLIDLAASEGFSVKSKVLKQLIVKYYPRKRRYLEYLLTVPKVFGGVGFRDSTPLRAKFETLRYNEIHPWLYYLGLKIRNQIQLEHKHVVVPLARKSEGVIYDHPLSSLVEEYRATGRYDTVYSEVPSVMQICKQISNEGLEGFRPYLVGIDDSLSLDAPLPLWSEDKEKELNRQRSLWEKALKRRHTWKIDQEWLRSLDEYLILQGCDSLCETLDTSAQRQYDLVCRVLVAQRYREQ